MLGPAARWDGTWPMVLGTMRIFPIARLGPSRGECCWHRAGLGDQACLQARAARVGTVVSMVGVLAAVTAAVVGLSAAVAPAASVDGPSGYSAAPRQSALDADYYLVDASGNWAAPRCIGDGSRGPRVQPVFVYRKGTKNRYAHFRTVLNRSTDLTTGIFERSSGARRTVRWVHDRSCRPVFLQVAVPASKTYNLVNLRRYLTNRDPRFRRTDRVYSLWVDATTSPNWSGLGGDRWSATWSSSWGFVWVDAHELVHALGAISPNAPHSTGKGHCYDAYDIMCYRDGGPAWRKTIKCPSPDSQYRLDCGDDDYFALKPRKGSWLARNPSANVANSRFLAKVKPRPLPVQPAAPTGVTRDFDSVDWQAVPGVRYDVGVVEGDTSITWVVQDTTAGTVAMAPISARSRVFVRAVNDAGYSKRVRADYV